jgi:hypothetical protein
LVSLDATKGDIKVTSDLLPLAGREYLANLEVFVPQTGVLAISVDSALLANQCSIWQSAGYFVTFAESIREAIVQLRDGDFDLVLPGPSIPADSRERPKQVKQGISCRWLGG